MSGCACWQVYDLLEWPTYHFGPWSIIVQHSRQGKKKQGEESCEGAQNFPFDLFVVPETALLASATVLPRYYSLVVMIRVSAPRARPLSIASE